MMDRARKYEAFLDDLAPIVDGDVEALERHAEFLADDDEARDLRHDAALAAALIADAGADYVPPADLEARLLAALDGGSGRTTSPGFAVPSALGAAEAEGSHAAAPAAPTAAGVGTPPVFVEPSGAANATSAGGYASPPAPGLAATFVEPSGAPPPSASPGPRAASGAPKAAPRRGVLLALPLVGAAALAAAAALAFVLAGGETDDAPEPTIATRGIDGRLEEIERAGGDGESGVTVRRPGSDGFVPLAVGAAIEAGSVVRTDERTRARLSFADGSKLVLNHRSELELIADAPRSFRMARGELVADVAHLDGAPRARFHTATGRVEVLGTKFELSATSDVTSVRVARGAVSVEGAGGAASEVRAGEEGVVRAGAAPEVAPVTDLARKLAWSELGGERDDGDALLGIGSLRARRPGERTDRERPLAVARQTVRVRIVGNVARTEVEQVFRNDDSQVLEGIYRFPLPPDAQIARLALDVDGRMEEGSFVERDRAAAIWRGVIRNATPRRERRNDEEFIWVPGPWRDPAILEWQRGGQFELRIFPIPARGERRVILAYTQTVPPQGGRRRYVYPLAHSADGSTRVGEFDVDVRVAGAERVSASGYEVAAAEEDGATRLRFASRDFVPSGDLVIEYELPGAERELGYWTYRGPAAVAPPESSRERDREVLDAQRQLAADERPYVAFALRPRLPRATERRDRDYVFVVDASQSMVGERYRRAVELASRVVAELDRRDRFAVLACDYTCRAMPGGLTAPSARSAEEALAWLRGIEPAGASDLVAVLREAVASVEGDRRDGRELHVVYVGDGTSTVGYRRASSLSAEVSELARRSRAVVSTVGVGGDADTLALSAIARAGGGHYVPYVPGQRTSVAAVAVLETTYGVSLESPRVTLPAGLRDSAPSVLPTIRAGQEVVLVARMDREEVSGDVVLRGTVAGQPFEQRYPVRLVATDAAGNAFVPRLWAAAQIDELSLRGRGEERARIIALSKAFGVMSRHTSLLVLESEAMFRAFRVDRNTAAPEWTGEEDAVAGGADGAIEVDDADAPIMAGAGVAGRSRRARPMHLPMRIGGGGGGAGRMPMAGAARAARAAPAVDDLMAAPEPALAEVAAPFVREPAPSLPERRPRMPRGRWMRRV